MDITTSVNNMQGIPLPPDSLINQMSMIDDNNDGQTKRKQVKNACTNCQKACKKCDDARPCPRCVRYGLAETCISSTRKERKKGIKRGPYKRKEKNDDERANSPSKSSKKNKNQYETSNNNDNSTPTASTFPSSSQSIAYTNYPPHLNQYHYTGYNNNDPNKLPSSHPYMMDHFAYPQAMRLTQPNEPNSHSYGVPPPTNGLMNPPSSETPYYIPAQQINNYSHLSFSKEIKNENANQHQNTQPMTPAPSTSTSSTSSPHTQGTEDDPSNINRLSQLCSAALDNQSSE